MERETLKRLNIYYYGVFVITLVVVTVMLYLSRGTEPILPHLDRMSSLGKGVQSLVILLAIGGIPLAFYIFNRKCNAIKHLADEVKYATYQRYGILRIVIVSCPMILGIIAFYWLGAYPSMLWVAGIGAIAFYLTKPTPFKIQKDLSVSEETY